MVVVVSYFYRNPQPKAPPIYPNNSHFSHILAPNPFLYIRRPPAPPQKCAQLTDCCADAFARWAANWDYAHAPTVHRRRPFALKAAHSSDATAQNLRICRPASMTLSTTVLPTNLPASNTYELMYAPFGDWCERWSGDAKSAMYCWTKQRPL